MGKQLEESRKMSDETVPGEASKDSTTQTAQGKSGNFTISKKTVTLSLVLGFLMFCFVGYFIWNLLSYKNFKITESELTINVLRESINEKDKEFSKKIEELRKSLKVSTPTNNTPPQPTALQSGTSTSYSPQVVTIPNQLSTEPNGGMTVYVNGGNMNVSEINLGNGAKMSFSGLRWTGSIPNLVTNMLESEAVGSVTEHKIPPFEDIVFEKTQETLASVWVSGRTYHDFLVAYNVGTTNSPVWVEPTSSEKVAGIRIKSLGPELTVRFTVKKKP